VTRKLSVSLCVFRAPLQKKSTASHSCGRGEALLNGQGKGMEEGGTGGGEVFLDTR
jgi:hypothetical protein